MNNHFLQDSASPWITIGISNSCKYKHVLYKKYLKGEVRYDSFKLCRNKLISIIGERKKQYNAKFCAKKSNKY